MNTNISKALLCAALTPLFLTSHALGAVITWDSTPINVDVNDPTQVSTSGTLLGAESVYAALGGPAYTVNTVTFNSSPNIAFYQSGCFNTGPAPGANDYQNIFYYVATTTNAYSSNDYWAILLSGLTPGQTYQLQLWTGYYPTAINTRFSSSTPDGLTDSHASPESSLLVQGMGAVTPQYIFGTFTADASNQNIHYYGDNGGGAFSAIQVRAVPVPEPQTWALAALGASAVLFRLRRKQRTE